jgi:hypothetical protein
MSVFAGHGRAMQIDDDAFDADVMMMARHTSHDTRHTSHVTRHTSHVTRHTHSVLVPCAQLFRHLQKLFDARMWMWQRRHTVYTKSTNNLHVPQNDFF